MKNNFLEQLNDFNKNINLNTSYPLSENDWKDFRCDNFDIFENTDDFSVYIHIPFCNHICKFCEYSKCKKQNIKNETIVIDNIISDIKKFKRPSFLYGFDIGGGTPTCLSNENFERIINISNDIIVSCNKPKNFLASIEATFDTLNDIKIKILKKSEFKRISFGIQTISKDFLINNQRYSNLDVIKNIISEIKDDFIINIDIMYGLNSIDKNDLKNTINFVAGLNVDQITLYEMRYNMIDYVCDKTKEEIIDEYNFCFNCLTKLGYFGEYGRNTFVRNKLDCGVSSYLFYRMEGYPYKGFGPAAQSMTHNGLAYNCSKISDTGSKEINVDSLLDVSSYENNCVYKLSQKELIAKTISISLYQGKINYENIKNFYNYDILLNKKDFLDFLETNKFVTIGDNYISLTKYGYKYYSAIGKLLYE